MDTIEELERLKKEIFNLKLKLAMKKNSKEELLTISLRVQELKRKYDILVEEQAMANGQVGFAFVDLMDVNNKQGRKR